MKYIYHHLGLGDHIMCNALVRLIASQFDKVSLFCKPHNKDSVEFMYRDLKNIDIISLKDDSYVLDYLKNKNPYDIIPIGFNNMYTTNSQNFDVSFYAQFGIDFDFRWSNFKVVRDSEREDRLFNHFELDDETKYIFIHDDERFGIDMNRVETNGMKIIRPDRNITENIFDYLKVIENASQAHLIESSFLFIIDSLNLNKETYAHRYPRTHGYMETPVYRYIKKIIS